MAPSTELLLIGVPLVCGELVALGKLVWDSYKIGNSRNTEQSNVSNRLPYLFQMPSANFDRDYYGSMQKGQRILEDSI